MQFVMFYLDSNPYISNFVAVAFNEVTTIAFLGLTKKLILFRWLN